MFVVLHTSSMESHVADVLNRNGNMAAIYASNALPISQGRIYVARPNLHLVLQNQHMWLDSGPKINRSRPAIDPLFQSAAENYGDRVIGVLLTGYLDDGSAGLAAIKRHGGMAIVQDPRDAYAPEMPRNALRLVKVDRCLPIAEIAPLLVKLVTGQKGTRSNVKHK
jgi:two-component system chemotaxis response regulator CheB